MSLIKTVLMAFILSCSLLVVLFCALFLVRMNTLVLLKLVRRTFCLEIEVLLKSYWQIAGAYTHWNGKCRLTGMRRNDLIIISTILFFKEIYSGRFLIP